MFAHPEQDPWHPTRVYKKGDEREARVVQVYDDTAIAELPTGVIAEFPVAKESISIGEPVSLKLKTVSQTTKTIIAEYKK